MRFLRILIVVIFLIACVVLFLTLKTVSERDTVIPEISDSIGTLHLSVKDDTAKLLQGLTARDDRDGDLTDRIIVERISRFTEPGACQVSYVVFDSSNNFCRYERDVIYEDYQPPRLQLSKPLLYRAGDSITVMDRILLTDCLDGDITHKLKLESSNVPDSTVGIYEIELRATSDYGDTVYAKLPLNISDFSPTAPKFTLQEYLVYTEVGEAFDPLSYVVSVEDHNGESLPLSQVSVISQADLTKPGGGQIRFEATDDRGVTGITYLTVIVEEA